MVRLRQLQKKYSSDQQAWCNRRLPLGLLELGWMVLPEDAGMNFSSYGEAHYMYAFTGSGITKKGRRTVPYFSSRAEALQWWEERLHVTPIRDRLRAAEHRFGGSVVLDESGTLAVEVAGVPLQLAASRTGSARRISTPYQGVAVKLEEGGSSPVYVAKHENVYLGTFGSEIEAAYAVGLHAKALLDEDEAKLPRSRRVSDGGDPASEADIKFARGSTRRLTSSKPDSVSVPINVTSSLHSNQKPPAHKPFKVSRKKPPAHHVPAAAYPAPAAQHTAHDETRRSWDLGQFRQDSQDSAEDVCTLWAAAVLTEAEPRGCAKVHQVTMSGDVGVDVGDEPFCCEEEEVVCALSDSDCDDVPSDSAMET